MISHAGVPKSGEVAVSLEEGNDPLSLALRLADGGGPLIQEGSDLNAEPIGRSRELT